MQSRQRVGLDDVGAGANVFDVNLADQIRIAEVQLVVTTIDVDALGVEHRAHCAVNYEDAIAGENFFKRLHFFTAKPAMKKPRAKQRGTSNRFEVFRVSFKLPSCLAGYFTWPQVALTHHVFHRCL